MIPYYSPNFGISNFFRSLFIARPKQRLIDEFQAITGKKYVLITNSCRSALYLTYKSLDKTGEVITTPLTCKVAIDPIVASGNMPVYSDIQVNSLLMDANLIYKNISKKSIGIQIVHLGGFCCDTKKIEKIARDNNLFIIEDCAQGLFSSYKGVPAGRIGDAACFSLIKNAYGIGGGILATNDETIYNRAKEIQNEMDNPSKKLIYFRIVRNIIESYRENGIGEKLYQKFMSIRTKVKPSSNKEDILAELKLKKPSKLEIRIAASQFLKAKKLSEIRNKKGMQLVKCLKDNGMMCNYSNIEAYDSSFVKFYTYHSQFNSYNHLHLLHEEGIEAKHLEHKYGSYYQKRLDQLPEFMNNSSLLKCKNYFKVHDHLISLPIHEKLTQKGIDFIVEKLKEILNNENKNDLD